jgi:hypothetical protein
VSVLLPYPSTPVLVAQLEHYFFFAIQLCLLNLKENGQLYPLLIVLDQHTPDYIGSQDCP